MFNPFQIFGLPKSASPQAIRSRYTQMLKAHHPDTKAPTRTTPISIQDIKSAYTILCHDGLRKAFITLTACGLSFSTAQEFLTYTKHQEVERTDAVQTSVTHLSLTLSFEESVLGVKKRFTVQDVSIHVPIPEHTHDQQIISYEHPLSLTQVMILHIKLYIAPHPFLSRQDLDLVCQCPISYAEALQGAILTVPTPYGRVTAHLPPMHYNKTLRVQGQGIRKGLRTGALCIRPIITPPDSAAPCVQAFIEAENTHPYNPRTCFLESS